jgi:hydrogenase maturation protein HypF
LFGFDISRQMTSATRIRVTGLVQGVGFRPYVWRLARETGIAGWVRNDGEGVEIAAEGRQEQVAALLARLASEAPPLARVDSVEAKMAAPSGFSDFTIAESQGGRVGTAIGHDTAICADCLAEMCDPAGRRWRHAFITCTHCGPRYTVTRALPYDRSQTSLAPFPLCPSCSREYRDPADRRFHAETSCCPECGPQLTLRDAAGAAIAGDAVAETLRLLKAGGIVAIKGLGGFHLACDARNAEAVARLRSRKAREEKPFAVMFANVASIVRLAEFDLGERALLESAERPIVLLKKRGCCDDTLRGVAPGVAWLGAMLPYTPLQYLLFHEAAGRPAGTAWLAEAQDLALVMTSANPGGEPLVIGNDEALARLAGIADAYLLHDREIVTRCDDSVVRAVPGGMQFIRRARAYTPRPIKLAESGPSVLSLGGWFKNTVCVTRGDEAFVSQHIGDLDNAATAAFLEETVEHLLGILEIEPAIVAHDLHPDFHSSRFAARFAAARKLPLAGVQHHHAHIAAVLAEHQCTEAAIGLALDGIGLGSDRGSYEPPRSLGSLPPQGAAVALGRPGGNLWGGELLRVDGARYARLGHLAELPLPGGDRAAREPWRMAAAVLHRLGRGEEIRLLFGDQPAALGLRQVLDKAINCPPTSSAGRWFDAAAGLLGIKAVMAFEGQAAMMLEGLAAAHGPEAPIEHAWRIAADGTLDLLPLAAAMADAPNVAIAAAQFHATLAAALAGWAIAAARRENIATVVLGGGCCLNAILTCALRSRLEAAGLRVLEARQLPPNDGGLSLGQAWIALRTLEN